ncbi:MAG: transketolase family protein [Firmicutes bacterium]|jgi:transketolase|nr:transketolase family protein [Bacillota bacterium]
MADKQATRQAYGEVLVELGANNKDLVVMDADLSKSTMTVGFSKAFPERFFNMGIAEQNMYGVAAGLAASGKTVVASTFAMFATGRAFEIIRNSIGYPHLNVKICATHAGVTVGEDGASHQAIEDIALMRTIPGMTVLNPSDGVSARKAVEAAVAMDGPVYVRLGRAAVPIVYDEDMDFEIGKGILVKDGTDVTIVATGIMVNEAIQAAGMLEAEGVSVRIIDIHTIKPIDEEILIKAAKETKGIVTAEEHSVIGGLGSAVAEVTAKNAPAKIKMIGIQDRFGQSGKPNQLMAEYNLTAADIVKACKEILA